MDFSSQSIGLHWGARREVVRWQRAAMRGWYVLLSGRALAQLSREQIEVPSGPDVAGKQEPPERIGRLELVPPSRAATIIHRRLQQVDAADTLHTWERDRLVSVCGLDAFCALRHRSLADIKERDIQRALRFQRGALYFEPSVRPALGSQADSAAEPPPSTEPTTTWVSVELLSEEGEPMPNQAFDVLLPTGELKSLTTNANGIARLDGLVTEGACEVQFTEQLRDYDVASR